MKSKFHVTACKCSSAGWCERHGCFKTPSMFEKCRRSETHFQAYEDGHVPDTLRKVVNFGKAVANHLATGAAAVDDDTFSARLKCCQKCDLFDSETTSCLHRRCGCRLEIKARWKEQSCPLGLW
jgi:hypothetical protein